MYILYIKFTKDVDLYRLKNSTLVLHAGAGMFGI